MYCLWGICFQLCQWLLFMAAGWTLPLPFADHWTGGSNSVRMLKCCRIFFCVWSWPRCIIPILGKTSLKVPIPILGIGFWTYSIAEDTPVFFKSMEQQRCYCTACCTLLLVFGNHTWIDWDINRYPFHDSKILKPMHSVSCGCVGGSNFQHIFLLISL